jgi:nitroreductase
MIIAVFSKKENDCVVAKRKYYLFDTGMSVGFMLLKATEMGLVAHPIAGFSESEAKKILEIPDSNRLITLVIVGEKTEENENLTEEQKETEKKRPKRKKFNEFCFLNKFEK